AEEQVAPEPADGQFAVQILLRLADDVAAKPVLEPRGLGDDQRQRDDADHERPDERRDLKQTANVAHDRQNACPMLKWKRNRRVCSLPFTSRPGMGFTW